MNFQKWELFSGSPGIVKNNLNNDVEKCLCLNNFQKINGQNKSGLRAIHFDHKFPPPPSTYQCCSVVRFLVKRFFLDSRLNFYNDNNIDLGGRGDGGIQ